MEYPMTLTVLQTCPWCGGGGGMGGGGMWGFGFLWPLLWLLIVAVLVIGVIYLFRDRTTTATNGRSSSGNEALATLRSRYARGEIDDEEFEQRRERLSQTDEKR